MGRRGITFAIAGVLGIGTLAGLFFFLKGSNSPKTETAQAPAGTTPASDRAAKASLTELAADLQKSDLYALAAVWKRVEPKENEVRKSTSEQESNEWIEVLKGLRRGYPRFEGSAGRATALLAAGRILEKFTVEPAPSTWLAAFPTVRDLVLTGIVDNEADVRGTALTEIAKLWNWVPARALLPVEEQSLAEWKDSLSAPVVRRLGDADPKVRVAAVACLGTNPIPAIAEKAVAYIEDRDGDVRQQVLAAFSRRPALLSDEAVLKRLHDAEPGIPQLAEIILKARGLNRDQIFLGKLITSPRPEMRASVIPMLHERTDIDPVVWFVQLSHDSDESVREQAVKALGEKDTPESRRRLNELATSDASAKVRAAAEKQVAGMTTAALPPLPGSPRLNPRAN